MAQRKGIDTTLDDAEASYTAAPTRGLFASRHGFESTNGDEPGVKLRKTKGKRK